MISSERSPVLNEAEAVTSAVSELGESPLWDPAGVLYWVDIPGQRLHSVTPSGSGVSVELDARVSAVELGTGDELLAVTERGLARLDPRSGRTTPIIELPLEPGARMNDAAIDPRGRCWAGSATHDDSRIGALFCVAGRSVAVPVRGLGMSNGLDWSPDGLVLYHVDTAAGEVSQWRYRPATGEVSGRRVLRHVPANVGLPDGLTVDAEGCLWVAIWGTGQVWRLDPGSGERISTVDVPAACPTSCAFGGEHLDRLYVTSAQWDGDGGLLYRADVGVRGLPPRRFVEGF
ncbi:SMP-30/gluconolactonase/LRE family protein [Amycolatopsis endophytica]|uniref:Sugar lactone lactonase YvrE n=1 Tax=Amycolatopsis endophytica TaxID=860233 RepID=A0A853B7W2_9PSEU|nr:SMP-30/gluconolactonase/LRE family protein [Amycolatopsis endophytica]NYI90862.1 sugar lactone lactonase YvrE [Amycolatopsis endophytica]